MDELFRLSGAARHSAAVDDWFDARPDELGHLARTWFDVIRSTGDDVVDLLHDGYPTALIDDAAFAYVNVFSQHINVGFFTGAFLPDPKGILQGTGKRMRHVKVSPVKAYDSDALREMIEVSYQDMTRRV